MTKRKKIIIHTDGGAKNNPGPAAIGVVIKIPGGEEKKYNEHIGETTNNVAEYKAVIFALQKLKQIIGKEESKESRVEVRSDSKLVVRQMQGEFQVKNEGLVPLFVQLWNLQQNFKSVDYTLIPREKNKEADKLVQNLLNTLI